MTGAQLPWPTELEVASNQSWLTTAASILLLSIASVAVVLWYGFNISARWKLRGIPGPKPSFLIGNLLDRPVPNFHENLTAWPSQYGKVMRYFLGKNAYVLCSDPKLIYEASVKDFLTFHDRKQPLWPSMGLEDDERIQWDTLWSKGKFWSTIRAASDSLFHTKALSSYIDEMHNTIGVFIDHCAKQDEGCEISEPLRQMSLQIIGSSAFGVDFVQSGLASNKLAEMSMAILQPNSLPTAFRLLYLAFPFLRGLINKYLRHFTTEKSTIAEFIQGNGYLMGASKALLSNCREGEATACIWPSKMAEKQGERLTAGRKLQLAAQDEGFRDFARTKPRPNSFFHKLIDTSVYAKDKSEEKLSEIQIISQAIVFILAGFDTSSTALSFTLFELAKRSDLQENIRREIANFDAGGRQKLGQADLDDFPYTQACLLEALRMHPPIHPSLIQQRMTLKNTKLGKYTIPKDTIIVMNTHGLALDEDCFDNPLVFRPERFLKEDGGISKVVQPSGFLSFGAGPHKFAIQECIFALVAFHRKFNYSLDPLHHIPDETLQLAPGLVFAPENGVWLKLHKH